MIVLVCDHCNREGPSGSGDPGNPDILRSHAVCAGWSVYDSTGRDFCPDCVHWAYYATPPPTPEGARGMDDDFDVQARAYIDRQLAIMEKYDHSGRPSPEAYERAVAKAARWSRKLAGGRPAPAPDTPEGA